MNSQNILDLFKHNNAFWEGHFLLSSGLHSDIYFQSALLLQYPPLAEQLGRALGSLFQEPIDVVVSPALGGLVIGHEVARAKNCRAIFSEKNEEGKPVLRRGFNLNKQERVLVIEDVITTGLSTCEVLTLVHNNEAVPVGVGALLQRSSLPAKLLKWDIPIRTLVKANAQSWQAADCPLCKKGIPIVKPGSRK